MGGVPCFFNPRQVSSSSCFRFPISTHWRRFVPTWKASWRIWHWVVLRLQPACNPKDCNIFGKHYKNNCTVDETAAQIFQWSVVDQVKVPQVPPGDYVLSFRWDSEQTPQVWASCSDVTIVGADEAVVI